MKIVVVGGSQRASARSGKIARLIVQRTAKVWAPGTKVDLLDLGSDPLPLWDEGFWEGTSLWTQAWDPVGSMLSAADGFVVVTPEWGGMVPPALKNLLLLCDKGELAHKPALIVAVSAGSGGAYPVAELRMSGYKNSHLCWIPDHVIIRDAGAFIEESETAIAAGSPLPKPWDRIDYGLSILLSYAEALQRVRQAGVVDLERFPYGM